MFYIKEFDFLFIFVYNSTCTKKGGYFMQLNYLDVLYSKFLKAKGYNKMSVDSKYMNDEFEEWLERCSMQLDEYRAYLDYRRIRYNDSDVVEVGHGSLDTLIPKNSKSLIITPYSNSFENKNEYNILDGYFKCNTLGIGAYEKDPKVHTFDKRSKLYAYYF